MVSQTTFNSVMVLGIGLAYSGEAGVPKGSIMERQARRGIAEQLRRSRRRTR